MEIGARLLRKCKHNDDNNNNHHHHPQDDETAYVQTAFHKNRLEMQ